MQITVKRNVVCIMDMDTKKTSLVEGEPKSEAGERKVPILPSLAPVLKAHRQEQDAMRQQAGSAWNEGNLVFCSTVGAWLEPRRIQTELDKINDTHGLERFGIHTFRHSCATILADEGIQLLGLQLLLGHSNSKMTDKYIENAKAKTEKQKATSIMSKLLMNQDSGAEEPPPENSTECVVSSVFGQLNESHQKMVIDLLSALSGQQIVSSI